MQIPGLPRLASLLGRQADRAERPVLYFIRGTSASAGILFDLCHYTLYSRWPDFDVVDVRLNHNGLYHSEEEVAHVLAFIQNHHVRHSHRPCFAGGWSRGALLAAEAAMRFPWVLGVVQIAPPTKGSRMSHELIPGTLGDYGPGHPMILDYNRRLAAWAASPFAVPMLVMYARHDGLIWPHTAACVDHAVARNVLIGGSWHHATLAFCPKVASELAVFGCQVMDALAQEGSGTRLRLVQEAAA